MTTAAKVVYPQVCAEANRQLRRQARERRMYLAMLSVTDATACQEVNAPTEPVEVVVMNGPGNTRKTRERCRRRKPDARFWAEITGPREMAVDRIMEGWLLTGGTVGCKTANYGERMGRGLPGEPTKEELARQARVSRAFKDWVRDCRREGHEALLIIDYLAGGCTLEDAAYDMGKRRVSARAAILEAVDLYISANTHRRCAA